MNRMRLCSLACLSLLLSACGGDDPGGSGGSGGAASGGVASGGGSSGGSPPASGGEGTAGGGGILSSGGGGGATGGASPGTGGQSGGTGGGTGAVGGGPSGGSAGSGGSPTGGGGSGGASSGGSGGSGGSTMAVFTCPSGSDQLSVSLEGKVLSDPIAGVPEIVNNGGFLEGPVWYDGSLYLSQLDFTSPINNADMLVYTPGGGFDVFIEGAGTNGLALAAGQRLLGASQVAAGVLSFDLNDPSATPQDVARMYMGATFNSPNDLTVRSDGNVYFTDPNGNCGNCTNQPVQGTYRVPPGGEPELIAGAPTQPNGISLSPDENTLYVGGTSLVAIPLNADGSVGTAAPFGDNVTGTDGMVVDCAGNLYVTLANGASIIVLDSSGTQLPGSFSVSQPTNVAFGGPESKTLYVTSFGDNRGQLRSVELEVPGFPY